MNNYSTKWLLCCVITGLNSFWFSNLSSALQTTILIQRLPSKTELNVHTSKSSSFFCLFWTQIKNVLLNGLFFNDLSILYFSSFSRNWTRKPILSSKSVYLLTNSKFIIVWNLKNSPDSWNFRYVNYLSNYLTISPYYKEINQLSEVIILINFWNTYLIKSSKN